jgi:hypothetical protein
MINKNTFSSSPPLFSYHCINELVAGALAGPPKLLPAEAYKA